MLIEAINIVLLGMLALTALAVVRLHDLFAVTIMFGIYSLLAAVVFVVLDAVDVAFTEAAVGVGISTVLMLATIGLVGRHEQRPVHRLLPLLVVAVTGAALVYGTLDMPFSLTQPPPYINTLCRTTSVNHLSKPASLTLSPAFLRVTAVTTPWAK